MKTKQFLLAGLCSLASALSAQQQIKLSEMDLATIQQSYGSPTASRAVTGEPLTVAGTTFTDGIGVQTNSRIKLSLQGESTRFTCKIGINDQSINYKDKNLTKIPRTDGTMLFYDTSNDRKQYLGIGKGNGEIGKGSVIFRILGDGKEL